MMKLLLISVVFFFLMLASGSDMNRNISPEKEVAESGITAYQTSGHAAIIQDEDHWMNIYFLMMKVFSPSRQMDIPADSHENHLSYKILHAFQDSRVADGHKAEYTSCFMRLLSVRHVNGFYIYFLRKLII